MIEIANGDLRETFMPFNVRTLSVRSPKLKGLKQDLTAGKMRRMRRSCCACLLGLLELKDPPKLQTFPAGFGVPEPETFEGSFADPDIDGAKIRSGIHPDE